MVKGVLLDLSGTVYIGDQLIPGALEAVKQLQAQNIPLRYLTNSSRSPRRTIVKKLQKMGFPLGEKDVFSAPQAIRAYLHQHSLKPWLLVHPAIEEEFADLAKDPPDTVVLGDAADGFSYANLNHAFRLLMQGARLLAVGDNRYFKETDGMSLDAGPFVAALEYAADCQALVLGKPSATFFHAAVSLLGCQPKDTLMVGDDVYTDINGALKAGLKAALVQTGKYRSGDEQQIITPGAGVYPDLQQLVKTLLSSNHPIE